MLQLSASSSKITAMLIKCKKCGLIFDGTKEASYCADCRHTIKSASVIRPRTCRTCGVTFEGGPRAWYCPCCRRVRQLKSDLEGHQRARLGITRKIGSIDLCANCGKEYTVNSARQKYCRDCSTGCVKTTVNAHKREYMQANAAENYQKKSDRYKDRRVCVVCGKTLQTTANNHSEYCSEECRKIRNRKYDAKRRTKKKETTQ